MGVSGQMETPAPSLLQEFLSAKEETQARVSKSIASLESESFSLLCHGTVWIGEVTDWLLAGES